MKLMSTVFFLLRLRLLDLRHCITVADALFDRYFHSFVDRSVLDAALVGSIVVLTAVRALRVLLVDWTAAVVVFLRRAAGANRVCCLT